MAKLVTKALEAKESKEIITETNPALQEVDNIKTTSQPQAIPKSEKTLNIINDEDLKSKVSDVEIFGEDIWHLLCKASSKSENWMKSTKVMNVCGGCLVQITTQNKDKIAESVVFVPHNMFKGGKIVGM